MVRALRSLPAVLGLLAASAGVAAEDASGIRPYTDNPRYWQYRGEPVLLIGGARQDNLFQIPDLEEHLDLLVSVGGNYIRNTMSSRDEGNAWPFARGEDGRYDLDQWNAEYWTRFENMLRWTQERGVFVQIEVWAFWDLFRTWDRGPWNPDNNTNYTTDDTRLATAYDPPSYSGGETYGDPHGFFMTVPEVNDDRRALRYQQRFVDKLLEHALRYDHVLWCITNEIHEPNPPQWSAYWARYIREKAAEAGRGADVTEMFWVFDFSHDQHGPAFDHPDVFTFFEASQNSAINDGEANWANLQYAYRRLDDRPRPINHVKIYGADTGPAWAGSTRDGAEAFWRNIIGGSASSRLHRPPTGLGLGEAAQAHIRAVRILTDAMDIFRCAPDAEHALLRDRGENEAYLIYEPDRQYAVYFPDGGSVELDLSAAGGQFMLRWLDITAGRWTEATAVPAGEAVALAPPGDGHWAALLVKGDGD